LAIRPEGKIALHAVLVAPDTFEQIALNVFGDSLAVGKGVHYLPAIKAWQHVSAGTDPVARDREDFGRITLTLTEIYVAVRAHFKPVAKMSFSSYWLRHGVYSFLT